MNEEFDTINSYPAYALRGWFDGFCPSNGIANDLNRKAQGVWAQKKEWDSKYNALKNGKQAIEWEALKKEVRRLEEEIKAEQIKLNQEKGISEALGLGAWCNGAVSKRKKAEESLRNAEKSLGQIKGAFQTLERQQTQGIREASNVIAENEKKINLIKQEIVNTRKKIKEYKAKRDNAPKPVPTNNAVAVHNAKTQSIYGKLKENAPLIIGGLAVVSAIVYVKSQQKKRMVKAVQV